MQKSLKALILLALLLLSSTATASERVALRAEASVSGAAIRLSDVFEGLDPSRDREIALAPAPGKSVTYDVRVLTELAGRYNLDWKPQSVADKVVLTRQAVHITPDMIRDAVSRKIKVVQKEGEKIDVHFDNRVLGLALPAGESDAFDLASFEHDQNSGRFKGEVVAQSGGVPVVQAIAGRLVKRREIPVLSRTLGAGTCIGESDLEWIAVDEAKVGEDVLSSASQIVGQELVRDKSQGDRIRVRDMIAPRLVKRGDIVTLKVETAAMVITTQGKALQDGGKGETIRVANTQSNRVVEGVVSETGVVRVGAVRRIASVE